MRHKHDFVDEAPIPRVRRGHVRSLSHAALLAAGLLFAWETWFVLSKIHSSAADSPTAAYAVIGVLCAVGSALFLAKALRGIAASSSSRQFGLVVAILGPIGAVPYGRVIGGDWFALNALIWAATLIASVGFVVEVARTRHHVRRSTRVSG